MTRLGLWSRTNNSTQIYLNINRCVYNERLRRVCRSGKMAKKKKKTNSIWTVLPRTIRFLTGPGRTVSLALLLVGGFVGGAILGWHYLGQRVVKSDEYHVEAKSLEMTSLPGWIRTDIRQEVFRDLCLDGPLSILDADAMKRVSDAFAVHPWVAKVVKVSKHYPASIHVELKYRRPVCMVVAYDPPGLRAVDVEGVALPSDDFSVREAMKYPKLDGIDTIPLGPVGTPWGDDRVVGAALIASAFGDDWSRLGLDRISIGDTIRSGFHSETSFVLHTAGGTKIIWGSSPKTPAKTELSANDKIKRLKQYADGSGGLARFSTLDLTNLSKPTAGNRTATGPSDSKIK
jgi:hypothetical protein